MFGSVTTPATFLNHRCSYSVATLGRDSAILVEKIMPLERKICLENNFLSIFFLRGIF
jgi:hypothetical protein